MEDEPCLIEVLTALESAQLYSMQDDCYLSLHAMSGHPQGKAIQLRALVQNQVMVILVDSSCYHFNSTNDSKCCQWSVSILCNRGEAICLVDSGSYLPGGC
jgi:hypothetical protein